MPKLAVLLGILIIFLVECSFAQKTLEAHAAVQGKLHLDGKLDEPFWQEAEVARDFTQYEPQPGALPEQRTEVRVLYTAEAIWVGARLYDSAPDSILKQFSIRDEVSSVNTDYFALRIDAMHTRQNYFRFVVTAAGVEADFYEGDAVWDAVWRSRVHFDAEGWTVEMEIPYSQLRFPPGEEQVWGINFERYIRRIRQRSFWSALDPAAANNVEQFGLLQGIRKIDPPIRLSLTPYSAAYLRIGEDDNSQTPFVRPSFSAGTDLRYGLSDNFTLDLALIPDFGDVLADDVEFNISPFEIYYAERRPFFTEGVDLFNRASLFYSRRVGNSPTRRAWAENQVGEGEFISQNPDRTQLLNAMKISGRTGKRLGLGFFNAVTGAAYAQIEDSLGQKRRVQTEPLTNYNVVVVDQQLGRNSYVSLVNTSVLRRGVFTDANVLGTEFRISDKSKRYAIAGNGAWSHRRLDDSLYAEARQNGFRYTLALQKIGGNWRFNLYQNTVSKDFDINDLGYVTATNLSKTYVEGSYNIFKPFWIYNAMSLVFSSYHERLVSPNCFTRVEMAAKWSGTFRNFLSANVDVALQPWGYTDYFEARTFGQPWRKPIWGRVGAWLSSDYRKRFAVDAQASYRQFFSKEVFWQESSILELSLSPRFRFSDHFNVILSNWVSFRSNNIGYATRIDGQAVLGSRYRQDMENVISANYLFNNRMNLSFRLRHYWALVDYSRFYNLDASGELLLKDIDNVYNTTYNAFNIDLIYRWRFLPGSELNLVWKNVVLRNDNFTQYNYLQNVSDMFDERQLNQFSVKVLYYLDYFRLSKAWRD